MTTERDPRTPIVLSWLREDAHENAERVLLRALDEVDTTQQRRSWWPARRSSPLTTPIRLALAAAAVLAIAIVGLRFLPAAPITGTPTIAPTAQQTAATSVVPPTSPAVEDLQDGALEPGRYRITVPGTDVQAIVTLGDGWSGGGGEGSTTPPWFINSSIYGSLSFWTVGNVGTDACDPFGTVPEPPVGQTVDAFIAALDGQENSETTTPEAVTVAGLSGQRLEIWPSATADCDQVTWWVVNDQERGRGADLGEQIPDVLYAMDVEGQRIVIAAFVMGQQRVFDDVLASMELSRG